MKVIRRLARHGHSLHVSIPPQVLNYLRWRGTDAVVLEVTERDTIEVRRVTPADLNGTRVSSFTLDAALPGSRG